MMKRIASAGVTLLCLAALPAWGDVDLVNADSYLYIWVDSEDPPYAIELYGSGPITIYRGAGLHSPPYYIITTEMLAMYHTSPAGPRPTAIHERPEVQSNGQIVFDTDPPSFPAESFFDVYMEVEYGSLKMINLDPVPLWAQITQIPPVGAHYTMTIESVEMVDKLTSAHVGWLWEMTVDITDIPDHHMMLPVKWSQPPEMMGIDRPSSCTIQQLRADDFLCDRPLPVRGVRFWGSYLAQPTPDPRPDTECYTLDFGVSFHLSNGEPHPFSLPLPDWIYLEMARVSRNVIGRDFNGDWVYEYNAILIPPFDQEPGTEYFMDLCNPFETDWGWHESWTENLDMPAFARDHGAAWNNDGFPDLSFELLHCWPCTGDLNGDDYRNLTDFTIFAAAYGSQVGDPNYRVCADLNGDGFINVTDFTMLASVFGLPCFMYGGTLPGELLKVYYESGYAVKLGDMPDTSTEIEYGFDPFGVPTLWDEQAMLMPNLWAVDPSNGQGLYAITHDPGNLTGLEDVGGTLYGTFVVMSGGASDLVIVDTGTGALLLIGPTGEGPTSGLAYDDTQDPPVMYGVTCADQPSWLVTVDLATGLATRVAPVTTPLGDQLVGVSALEFGPDGKLYGGLKDNAPIWPTYLIEIDETTGQATQVGRTGFSLTGLTTR